MVRFLAKFGGSSFFLFRQLNGIVSQTFLIMQKSLLSLFTLLPLCGVAQTEKPNVILLVADDLGYGDLSCYGATRVQTPAVDSLATAGIRFTNMHACASTSTPSRYAMLTGEYPFRRPGTDVAAGNAGMIIKPQRVPVADLMQRGGYAAAIGVASDWVAVRLRKTGMGKSIRHLPTSALITITLWLLRPIVCPVCTSKTGGSLTTIPVPPSKSVIGVTFRANRRDVLIRNS